MFQLKNIFASEISAMNSVCAGTHIITKHNCEIVIFTRHSQLLRIEFALDLFCSFYEHYTMLANNLA